MKLVRVVTTVHLASPRGGTWMGQHMPTFACSPRRMHYDLHGHPTEFDGTAAQVTCKKCLQKLARSQASKSAEQIKSAPFKEGDRVHCVRASDGHYLPHLDEVCSPAGAILTIKSVRPGNSSTGWLVDVTVPIEKTLQYSFFKVSPEPEVAVFENISSGWFARIPESGEGGVK